MKILVITHRVPFPPDKGEKIRGYHWICALSKNHKVDLLTLGDEYTPSNIATLRELVQNLWVVRLNRWGFPIRAFFAFLASAPLTLAAFYSIRFGSILSKIINKYDLCIGVCSNVAWYFEKQIALPRIIVDFVDFDTRKWLTYSENSRGGWRKFIYYREAEKLFELDCRLARLANRSVFINSYEAELSGFSNATVIPNPVPSDWFRPISVSNIDKLVFVGQMDYLPNVDACLWFSESVWPALRRFFPELRWFIVGRAPTESIRKLGNDERIVVTGEVESVTPYLRSAIGIAPIRMVFGTQNKVLQFLSAGLPTVVNTDVAERIGIDSIFPTADAPQEWINLIERIIDDRAFASKLAKLGQCIVRERFSTGKIYKQMNSLVEDVVDMQPEYVGADFVNMEKY